MECACKSRAPFPVSADDPAPPPVRPAVPASKTKTAGNSTRNNSPPSSRFAGPVALVELWLKLRRSLRYPFRKGIDATVVGADDYHVIDDRRRTRHRRADFVRPRFFAGFEAQNIKPPVVRT